MIKKEEKKYDIELDAESVGDEGEQTKDGMRQVLTDVNACLFFAYNGKFGGGRIQLSPMSLVNDGLFEVSYYTKRFGLSKAIQLFDEAKSGAEFVYDPEIEIRRVK